MIAKNAAIPPAYIPSFKGRFENVIIVFMENLKSFFIEYLLSPAYLFLASYSIFVVLKPTF